MKKIFMALMAVAAIAFTSCGPDNDPSNPGNNDNKPSDNVKTAAVTFIPAITTDWLKLADFYIYDSIAGQAAKAETLTDLYIARTSKPDDIQHTVAVRTTEFENATLFKGCYIKVNLSAEQKYEVRAELKLKDNYVEILQAMDPEEHLNLYGVMAYGMQSADPNYNVTGINESVIQVGRLMEAIEKNPNFLTQNAELEGRTISTTFTTNGSVIGAK